MTCLSVMAHKKPIDRKPAYLFDLQEKTSVSFSRYDILLTLMKKGACQGQNSSNFSSIGVVLQR